MRRRPKQHRRRLVLPAASAKRVLILTGVLATAVYLYCTLVVYRNPQPSTRNPSGGTIGAAWRGGCFGASEDGEGLAGGGGGTGVLKHIANAYLQPGRLVGGMCGGRKVVAFAITLTMDGHHMDGAAVLAASIDSTCAASDFLCDLVAFLHDDVGPQSESVLARLGFRVLRPGLPLDLNDIEDKYTRQRVEKGGCCGAAELMKFFAYTLTEYHRVIHLDTDTLVLQPLDPLLNANESLLYTTDVNMANNRSPTMPVQGGFLVIRPDQAVFEDLVRVVKTTRFNGVSGWGRSNIGLFWGGITVQGLLPYYYEHEAAPENKYRPVNRCLFNNMVDRENCRKMDVSTIRSAHFTNCQKPWHCIYPHPKHPLCSRLTERWFDVRNTVEHTLGLEHTVACPKGFKKAYLPMRLLR